MLKCFQFDKWRLCFNESESWGQRHHVPRIRAVRLMNQTVVHRPLAYDFYIRNRPDIMFAYPISMWPPPRTGPFVADVHSRIGFMFYHGFTWSNHLLVTHQKAIMSTLINSVHFR